MLYEVITAISVISAISAIRYRPWIARNHWATEPPDSPLSTSTATARSATPATSTTRVRVVMQAI